MVSSLGVAEGKGKGGKTVEGCQVAKQGSIAYVSCVVCWC